MLEVDALKSSMNLLSPEGRKRWFRATLAQMFTATLDLAGVLLLAGVVAILLSGFAPGSTPSNESMILSSLPQLENPTFLVLVACSAAVLLIAKSLINVFLNNYILALLAKQQISVVKSLSRDWFTKPLLGIRTLSSQETGYAFTAGMNNAIQVILLQSSIVLSEAFLLVILTIGLLLSNPLLTLFALLYFSVIALLIQRLLAYRANRLATTLTENEIASLAVIQNTIRAYREISVGRRTLFFVGHLSALRSESAYKLAQLNFVNLIPRYILEIALVIGAAALSIFEFRNASIEDAGATVVLFLVAGSRIIPSILRLQTGLILIRSASSQALPTYRLREKAARLDNNSPELFDSTEELSNKFLHLPSERVSVEPTRVCVENISYSYPGASSFSLSNVSLRIAGGESLALVGPSGSGKSTLVDLIIGMLTPDKGSIFLDGEPISSYSSRNFGAIGYVPQEVGLFDGSLLDNLVLGIPESSIDFNRVSQVLSIVGLTDFVAKQADGLLAAIGEFGAKLSGGQRQRLGLARALYTQPSLLVLDEATSALDAESEEIITKALRDLRGRTTIVSIAHRLATIRSSDQVCYIDKGILVASGSFDSVRHQVPDFDHQAQLMGL